MRLFFDVKGTKLVPDGHTIREKPTLLLLHGGPGADHSGYKPAMSQFTDICQVVYFDMRGHGRSDPSDEAHWTLGQWADDVVGLCDALEIEKPIVMGISFGGNVAIAYVTKYPDHPAKLILGSTCASTPDVALSVAAFERLGGTETRDIAQRFLTDPTREHRADFLRVCLPLYNRMPRDPQAGQRSIQTPEVAEFFRRGELRVMNFVPELHRVLCPTLVFGGEEDPMVPIQYQAEIAESLPQHLVQFHRIANAGHSPQRDDPRVFDLIRAFILS